MVSKKLTKKQSREKQILEDKKFTKTLIIRFGLLLLILCLILVFVTYWCDTKYNYRKTLLYGKEIPGKLICMNGNSITYHKTIKVTLRGNTFYVCSEKCKNTIIDHYDITAFTADAFSGDTICKSNAIIGLKVRGNPSVVYFENTQNFEGYFKIMRRK
jgi:ribosomal protein L24E